MAVKNLQISDLKNQLNDENQIKAEMAENAKKHEQEMAEKNNIQTQLKEYQTLKVTHSILIENYNDLNKSFIESLKENKQVKMDCRRLRIYSRNAEEQNVAFSKEIFNIRVLLSSYSKDGKILEDMKCETAKRDAEISKLKAEITAAEDNTDFGSDMKKGAR